VQRARGLDLQNRGAARRQRNRISEIGAFVMPPALILSLAT
jgi:hypothetical protein